MKSNSVTTNYLLLSLIGFSIFVLGLGYFQIRHAIFGPFAGQKIKKPVADLQKLLVEAQNLDTDHDGLTDFEETYKYHTSIYLPDSDSDGFSDAEEIKNQSNPLNSESTPLNKKVAESNLEQTFEAVAKEELSNEQKEVNPQEIRDLLVQKGGLSKEAVDKIDDKTLLKWYNEVKAETGFGLEDIGQSIQPSSVPSGSKSNEELKQFWLKNLEQLTPSEIRQVLISNGMDAKLLEQIDDQTLKQVFLNALKQQE
jgi:hypothetical protein